MINSRLWTRFLGRLALFIRLIFIVVLVSILFINSKYTLYIFNGWYITYNSTPFIFTVIALLISVGFITGFRLIKISDLAYKKLYWAVFILLIMIRIGLAFSFEVKPAGDAQSLFDSAFALTHGHYGDFQTGGYISIYTRQLGGATLLIPFVTMFKDHYIFYVLINASLIQTSIFLFTNYVKKSSNIKNSFITLLLLATFIPLYFYQFFIYSEAFGLLFLSLMILIYLNVSKVKSFNVIVLLIVMMISIVTKENLIILLIAFLIIQLLFIKLDLKNFLFICMLIIVGLFSSSILTRVYNHFTDWKIGENDLPFSTNIAIGLQGIGFTNEYINYFSWNNNDTEKLSLYIDQKIKNRLNELQDPNALFPFIYDKFLYSWSDQDFDSMNFIMPFKSEVTLNDFEVDNSIRVGRASPDTHSTTNLGDFLVKNVFLIRNIEKVYLLTLLFLALYNSIKTIKRRNLHSLLLELFVIGTTLAFIIVETQPRYLLYTMVILIVYTGLTMSNRESN